MCRAACLRQCASWHAPDVSSEPGPLPVARAFDIDGAKERLAEATGGYEIVHRSAGVEVGVYVLVAAEPDRQQPHEDDEI